MKTCFTTMNEAIDHFLADGYAVIKAGECFNGMEFVVVQNGNQNPDRTNQPSVGRSQFSVIVK